MGYFVQRWQNELVLFLLVVAATIDRSEQQPLQKIHHLGRCSLRWPLIPWPRVPAGLLCCLVTLRRCRWRRRGRRQGLLTCQLLV
uniref:Putative secreted protein n=1 Tax=Anopheles darlingi TaxID=43151 RepID=A0A2M4DGU3_ANODA